MSIIKGVRNSCTLVKGIYSKNQISIFYESSVLGSTTVNYPLIKLLSPSPTLSPKNPEHALALNFDGCNCITSNN